MLNWLECLRSRKQPNAPIQAGYSHAVACIMTAHALGSGRRKTYDPQTMQRLWPVDADVDYVIIK